MHDDRTAERDALAIVVESVDRALEILPRESAWRRWFLEAEAVADAALAAIGQERLRDGRGEARENPLARYLPPRRPVSVRMERDEREAPMRKR